MFKSIMAGVDKTLVRNLVILHTAVIALSNYLVTIRFDVFPGADLPLFGSFPLAAAASFAKAPICASTWVRFLRSQ